MTSHLKKNKILNSYFYSFLIKVASMIYSLCKKHNSSLFHIILFPLLSLPLGLFQLFYFGLLGESDVRDIFTDL